MKIIFLIMFSFLVVTSSYAEVIIPQKYQALIKNYRHKLERVSGLEPSPLHWGHGVVVYGDHEAAKIYRHNHLEFIKEFEMDEGDDEDDDEFVINYKKYKVGTVFVKEQFSLPGKHSLASTGIPSDPSSIIVMIKEKPGYDPAGNDWKYVYFMVDGNIVAEGKSSVPAVKVLCSNCHQNVKQRDFIFSRIIKFKQPTLK